MLDSISQNPAQIWLSQDHRNRSNIHPHSVRNPKANKDPKKSPYDEIFDFSKQEVTTQLRELDHTLRCNVKKWEKSKICLRNMYLEQQNGKL